MGVSYGAVELSVPISGLYKQSPVVYPIGGRSVLEVCYAVHEASSVPLGV